MIHRIVCAHVRGSNHAVYFSRIILVSLESMINESALDLFISVDRSSLDFARFFPPSASSVLFVRASDASLTLRKNLSFYSTVAILFCFTAMQIHIRQLDTAISLCRFCFSFSPFSFSFSPRATHVPKCTAPAIISDKVATRRKGSIYRADILNRSCKLPSISEFMKI